MNIVAISDCSSIGSGYATLTIPLMDGLQKLGHDVKILALEYNGAQHNFDFSMIPMGNLEDTYATLSNLARDWGVDVVIVLLDIPIQIQFLEKLKDRKFKYIGVFPVESDPLGISWAMNLSQMDKSFVISEFGTQECLKVGVDAEHLQLGIDTLSWRVPTQDERKSLRESFGFTDDTFTVLTVADNQERKNLVRGMEIFADFTRANPDVDAKYIMVTRENLPVGWKLRDYAQTLNINHNFQIFERGLSFAQLWSMYAVSDCFLLTSKCEGLGLPILEAMSVGVPCIATKCTAMEELLSDGRGLLIDPLDDFDLRYIDPFGNGNRYFAKRSHGLEQMQKLYECDFDKKPMLEYTKSRNWAIPVFQLSKAIDEMFE